MILEPFRRQLDDVKRPNGRREIGMPELDSARHGFVTDPYGARHYEKLGRFIFQYAQAEAHFHLAFRHYSQTSIADARGRFRRRIRIDEVIKQTTELIEQNEVVKDFENIEQQFKVISKVRHRIIHRGWSALADKFLITDIATAPDINNLEILNLTFAEIDDMIEDLILILVHLRFRHIAPDIYRRLPQNNGSWRYKLSGEGKARSET